MALVQGRQFRISGPDGAIGSDIRTEEGESEEGRAEGRKTAEEAERTESVGWKSCSESLLVFD